MGRRERTSRTASLPEECTLQVRLSIIWVRGYNYLKITETIENPGKKLHMDALKMGLLSGIA